MPGLSGHYFLNLIRAHAILSLQNSDTCMHILCPLSCRGLIIVMTRRGHSPTFSLINRVGKVWWYTGWTPRIIILAKVWPSWSNFGQYNDAGCSVWCIVYLRRWIWSSLVMPSYYMNLCWPIALWNWRLKNAVGHCCSVVSVFLCLTKAYDVTIQRVVTSEVLVRRPPSWQILWLNLAHAV